MGYDVAAYVMVGVLVREDEMAVTERVRGCSHEERPHVYCAECGARTWQEKRTFPDWWEEQEPGNGLDMIPIAESPDGYVGKVLAEVRAGQGHKAIPSPHDEQQASTALSKLGIRAKPELMLILYESY